MTPAGSQPITTKTLLPIGTAAIILIAIINLHTRLLSMFAARDENIRQLQSTVDRIDRDLTTLKCTTWWVSDMRWYTKAVRQANRTLIVPDPDTRIEERQP